MNRASLDLDEAVRAYVRRGITKAGSADRLADLIEPHLGHRYSRENVSGWTRRQQIPGRALVAIRKVTGLSLDALTEPGASTEEGRSLQEQIAELRERLGTPEPYRAPGFEMPADDRPLEERVAELGRALASVTNMLQNLALATGHDEVLGDEPSRQPGLELVREEKPGA